MDSEKVRGRCAAFHGHVCGGLAIGCQAARLAAELLGIGFSDGEEIVCAAENDACGAEAIQVMLKAYRTGVCRTNQSITVSA